MWVSNKAGSQTIAIARHATEVKDVNTTPTPPAFMDEKEIAKAFGKALGAQPEPADIFILYFKKGSTDIADESVGLFPAILAAIKAKKSTDISVVGHSDTVGARQKNYELSFERARRLKEILVSKGVDPHFVEIDSHGEDNLLVKTADEMAEPRNRRVEVTVR